jgi:glucokinase
MVLAVGGPKCACGSRGCFEALASRTAIFRQLTEAVAEGKKTLLTESLGPDLKDLRSGDLRKAIRKGDKLVEKIVEEAAEYTGVAVANVINLLNPQVVVLGGGVIDALGDEMMAIILETAHDYGLAGASKGVDIIASKNGDDAGITGGAVLALRQSK